MKRQYKLILFSIFFCGASLHALGPLTTFFTQEWEEVKSFTKQVEKNIEELQKRKAEVEENLASFKPSLESIQKSSASLKERVQRARNSEFEFITQQLAITNKTVQVLSEIGQVGQELLTTLDAHIKLLQEYKQDPEFKNKGFQPEQKSIYSIDDFQKINSIMLAYDGELKALESRLKKITLDYDALKKNQVLAQQEYEEKKREQKELKTKDVPEDRLERKKLTLKQRGELLDAEERLLGYKKDLASLKLMEADQRAQFV